MDKSLETLPFYHDLFDLVALFSSFFPEEPPAPVCPAKVQSVDDFVPDERLDRSFLEESLPSKSKMCQPASSPAVDSDR